MNFYERARRLLRRSETALYQTLRFRARPGKAILFIFACQRSGTTLMTRIFERDWNARVFGEFSVLSSQDRVAGIRLNALPDVKAKLDRTRCGFAVLKPLTESQRAGELLEFFPESRGLWMFRHYRDVASSCVVEFGARSGIRNLRDVLQNQPGNWRSEHVSEATREMVRAHFSEEMDPYDATALFWWVRNRFFFEQAPHDRLLLCEYQDLVSKPQETLLGIYNFLGEEFPGERIVREVHQASVGKGGTVKLSPHIEALCEEMLEGLNRTYASQQPTIR